MIRKQQKSEKKFTGRTLCLVEQGTDTGSVIRTARRRGGLRIASASDYQEGAGNYTEAFKTADGVLFDALGIMLINPDRESNMRALSARSRSVTPVITEPERYVYALAPTKTVVRKKVSKNARNVFKDSAHDTWGIQATLVSASPYTGKGIKIAVLDTGFFDKHPDFKKRNVTVISKVEDITVQPQDMDGHGTHCIGVSTGYQSNKKQRYGVAKDASIFSVKVLDDNGEGTDGDVIAGINWAVKSKCHIISMSLGDEADFGDEFSTIYENAARRAMKQGSIIIAAAGNESGRKSGIIRPIGHPANCPSIMAVAALDERLDVADFSCASDPSVGAQIDVAAPGVSIYSSYIKPDRYEFLDGTSMATPFVAGIAALYLEQDPSLKPLELWSLMAQGARRLPLPSTDVGAGLIQAPVS